MMQFNYLKKAYEILLSTMDWRTNRKIVVFESDDWGSLRIPSKQVYNQLLHHGIKVDQCNYCRYDALETTYDLDSLFNVLIRFKDSNNSPPVFTSNMLMANPDFEKIKQSGFLEYHYERFTETYKRTYDTYNTFSKLNEGIRSRLFHPQFHGREHLNVRRWMTGLKQQLPETSLAFHLNTYAISSSITTERRKSYLETFGLDHVSDTEYHMEILRDGMQLFKDTFGCVSESFIAPNYTWHPDLDRVLLETGVNFFQSSGFRIIPHINRHTTKAHFLGSISKAGQVYLKRNCVFEPSLGSGNDVELCLKGISSAILSNRPAIIQSHRLNYIGVLDERNRDRNLSSLDTLIRQILHRWPDVEFMSTNQLGNLIKRSINGR